MPFYEYQCEACGHELEELQKISDPVLTKCPECNKNRLTKLVSAAAFKLTGTGWYETDFKNKGKPAEDGKSSGDKDGSGSEKSKSDSTASDKKTINDKKDAKPKKKETKSKKTKPDAK